MDRTQKIKLLEQIMNGQPVTVGRYIPLVYTSKFQDRRLLVLDLKEKYGKDAKVLMNRDGKVHVISDKFAYWPFYEREPGKIRSGHITFTEAEYKQFLTDLDDSGNVWHEVRTYGGQEDTIMHWKLAPGCEPITMQPDNQAPVMTTPELPAAKKENTVLLEVEVTDMEEKTDETGTTYEPEPAPPTTTERHFKLSDNWQQQERIVQNQINWIFKK